MYYRARYTHAECARFISEDPIGWASGQTNNYAYVGGDPVSFTDPSGNIRRTADVLLKLIEIPDDFFTGREIACAKQISDMWMKWARDTHSKPMSDWLPSDWYIAQNATREAYAALLPAIQKALDKTVDAATVGVAKDIALSGLRGVPTGAASLGVAVELGMAYGCK
jgi:uncharacterized protein RhaS with RHS repeats